MAFLRKKNKDKGKNRGPEASNNYWINEINQLLWCIRTPITEKNNTRDKKLKQKTIQKKTNGLLNESPTLMPHPFYLVSWANLYDFTIDSKLLERKRDLYITYYFIFDTVLLNFMSALFLPRTPLFPLFVIFSKRKRSSLLSSFRP